MIHNIVKSMKKYFIIYYYNTLNVDVFYAWTDNYACHNFSSNNYSIVQSSAQLHGPLQTVSVSKWVKYGTIEQLLDEKF